MRVSEQVGRVGRVGRKLPMGVDPTWLGVVLLKGWWRVGWIGLSLLGLLAKIKCSICSYQLNI